IRILKENGYNAIRSAHNPCSKALLEACDRLGMLVMDEYVDAWYIHKTEYDYVNNMRKWWKTDLKEMVEKDYNHPCVIMYSTGNEVAETAQKEGIELTSEMTKYLHSLDASRPVTCGINIFFNFLSSIGFGVYSDEKAKESAKKSAKDKPVGSEFYNTLAGLLGDRVMKFGATLYPCDLKTKDAFAGMDIAGYNYGIYRYKHDLKKYPNRLILGSETFCRDAYLFWEVAKKNPGIIGDFVWAGMDYIGEAGIGAWEYSDYAPQNAPKEGWLTAGSGRIDILGNPNGEALYTKVVLEQTDEIFIAVKPVYQKGNHSPSAWKMTDAVPSWSYRGCEGYTATIEVYARAEKVALFLNGALIGEKKLKKTCRVIFHAKYQNGILKAVAYDELGNVMRETQLETASEQTQLLLQPELSMVKPEGLIYIPLCYTDEAGIWKPMEKHELVIKVAKGKLKGFGNACSYNPQGYQKNKISTYYGRAMAVVQADDTGHALFMIKDETSEYTIKI
ncbi:MAG: glycoside hydrolase family 2 TIM barrel-domain containing protein, partial [Lachnospiraceae bacterium]|nr:glycoside hydrolase family 2 TIM barrel-domain containing protein [Lachnospiraceae bacterium]